MRRLLFALLAPPLLVACPSSTAAPDAGEGAGDGGEVANLDGDVDAEVTPTTEACTGVATTCLSGTAAPSGFTVAPKRMKVELYREYPASGAVPVASVPVALDGTWAFSSLGTWGHYFVQLVADFGQPVSLSSVVGALTVPSTGSPIALRVLPVQLSLLQQGPPGGPQLLVSALGYVFDPLTGAPVSNATVAVVVGGTPQAMTWTQVAASTYAYLFTAPSMTPAQATYTVTTSQPGGATSTWQLTAPTTTTLMPNLTAPAGGATIPANQPLTVEWPAQAADAETVELYAMAQGTWSSVYASPIEAADVLQQTVPSTDVTAGSLLVNVQFLLGGCPPTADGCVAAGVVASAQVTAQ